MWYFGDILVTVSAFHFDATELEDRGQVLLFASPTRRLQKHFEYEGDL